jgi:2-amino-4-hydroxy-6-hydroxymethyldihydropteridine diphosphokinase
MAEKKNPVTAWLGLGANQGEMMTNLTQAALALSTLPGSSLLAVSPVFETAAVGAGYSGVFLNAVVSVQTKLTAEELLEHCREIERDFGRDRRQNDRTLDLDILFYGHAVIQTGQLQIPHPRLAERRFVLEPLSKVAPDLVHPELERTVAELLQQPEVQEQEVTELAQPLLPAWGC